MYKSVQKSRVAVMSLHGTSCSECLGYMPSSIQFNVIPLSDRIPQEQKATEILFSTIRRFSKIRYKSLMNIYLVREWLHLVLDAGYGCPGSSLG